MLIRYGETIASDIVEALEKGPEGRFHYLVAVLESIGGQSAGAYLDAHFYQLVKEDKELQQSQEISEPPRPLHSARHVRPPAEGRAQRSLPLRQRREIQEVLREVMRGGVV